MNEPTLPPSAPATDPAEAPTQAPSNNADFAPLAPRLDAPAASGPPHATGGSRYRIVRPLARGGLGEVFLAHDEELDREVALKEIQTPFADNVDSRTRFVREGKVTGGLEHPGVVPVYGLGTYVDGRPYYAMRFIKGESLQEAIARFHQAEVSGRDPGERALALRQLLRRFIDMCNAIAYAHSRGVLHRDLKPANLMLGEYGETLVVDWGLARAFDRHEPEPGTTLRVNAPAGSGQAVTQMGSVIGTPSYMSPEQAAGKLDELGPASDIYSLGATLYCLLTGKLPIDDPDVLLTLVRVQTGEFPPPHRVKPKIPAALEAICLKAMALKPAKRYASAKELADDVEHWLADEPVSARRESLWERGGRLCRRRPVFAAVLGCLVAMDVAILGMVVATTFDLRTAGFLPFAVFGGVITAGLGLLLFSQVWWIAGALAGAILASRGTKSGGLIGLMIGGAVAWVTLAIPPEQVVRRVQGTVLSVELVLIPAAGVVGGMILGLLVLSRSSRKGKRRLLGTLVSGALGFLGGSLIAAAAALGQGFVGFLPVLYGSFAGAVAGGALGAISAAIRDNPKRALVVVALGGLIGAILGFVSLVLAVPAVVHRFADILPALVLGGLFGSAIGALLVGFRGEVKRRVIWSTFLGGRIGIVVCDCGFIVVGTLMYGATQGAEILSLANPRAFWLSLIALAIGLLPFVVDVGLGMLTRVSWDRLLTRAIRGSLIGAVLGPTAGLVFGMAGFLVNPSRPVSNPPPSNSIPPPPPFGVQPGGNLGGALYGLEEGLRKDPGNVELAVNVANAYNSEATRGRDQNLLQIALSQSDHAIAILQPAVEREPRHVRAREALRDSYSGRAEALVLLNRPGEALAAWDKALELETWSTQNELRLHRALALARSGKHVQAAKECETLAAVKDLPPATLYTLARVYASCAGVVSADTALPADERQQLRERYARSTLANLTEAETAGYFKTLANRAELMRTKDFEALHGREDFKRWQEKLAMPRPGIEPGTPR